MPAKSETKTETTVPLNKQKTSTQKKTSDKPQSDKTSQNKPAVQKPVNSTNSAKTTTQSNQKQTDKSKMSKPVTKVESPKTTNVSNETNESSVSDEFTLIVESLAEVTKKVKELTTQIKQLQKHVSKEHKDLEKVAKGKKKKNTSTDKPKRAPSGFAKPTKLSKELCTFLGVSEDTELARTEVTKKITTYVKEFGLQNQENKKMILPDDKLGALLKVPKDETLTYFNLQRYMKVHFQKSQPAEVAVAN